MKNFLTTKTHINGQDGLIIHNKLLSDGPVNPKTHIPLINPASLEKYPGIHDHINDKFHEDLIFVRSSKNLGAISDFAKVTPFFLYDHPALQQLSQVGFTDGIHVFINSSFIENLYQKNDNKAVVSFINFMTVQTLNYNLEKTYDSNYYSDLQTVINTFEKNYLFNAIDSLSLPESYNIIQIAELKLKQKEKLLEIFNDHTNNSKELYNNQEINELNIKISIADFLKQLQTDKLSQDKNQIKNFVKKSRNSKLPEVSIIKPK